jgi:hypothetical protein
VPARSFAARTAPLSVRITRVLLMLESGLLILAGIFAAMIGVVLGGSNSISFGAAQVSGGGAVALGLFYGMLGLAALYIALEMWRLTTWTRAAAIVLQAVLIVLFLARGDFSASLGVSLALCLAIAGLLLSPTATAALGAAPTSAER